MYIRFKHLLLANALVFSVSSPLASADNLQQIFDLATSNDPQIRAAEAQLKANQQVRTISRSALLPQINASAGYDETERTVDPVTRINSDGEVEVINNSSDTDETSYGASLNQVLFDLPSWYNYKSGDSQAEKAEMDYLLARQNLIIRTAEAYLNVLRAIDNLATVSAEEKAFASQLEQTQQRYEVGLIAVTDVHEAQASYDDVIARLLNSQGSLSIAFENLTTLTGQEHKSVAPLSENYPILNPEPTNPELWVEMALANNFSLASSMLSRDASEFNMKSARMEHMPSINLSLSRSENQPGGAAGLFGVIADSQTDRISVSLDMPIFTGGRVSAQRRQAYYQYVQAEENLNSTRRTLIQNTRNQHLSVRIGVSTVNARKQAITSSQSAYEATKAGYDVGTRNLVDVLNSERNLFQAKRDYFNERYDYIIDMLNLKQSAGNLSSDDITNINQWLDLSGEVARSVLENTNLYSNALTSSEPRTQNTVTTAEPSNISTANKNSSNDLSNPESWIPEEMLQQWASDWSNLNISDYLDHYADNFKPRGQLSDDWRSDRRERLLRLSDISISLRNVDVIELSDTRARVLLDQEYTSPGYSDSSEKEFVLIKENGRWKIASEKALSISSR